MAPVSRARLDITSKTVVGRLANRRFMPLSQSVFSGR
jgi:hypothetical protein